MDYQKHSFVYRSSALFIAGLLLIFGLSFVSTGTVATVSVPQDNQAASPSQERQLGIGVKPHLPIKIKAKNLNNEKWAHDLEIEVTNKSDRPIYYLSFLLVIQGIKSDDGKEYAFWLHYGRPRLNDFSTPLDSTDVPLLPNDTCVLKIPESEATGWEITRTKKKYAQPIKVGLVFQSLNFGDGTGYTDSGGTYININKKVDFKASCLSPPELPLTTNSPSFSFLPAAVLPVNVFSAVGSALDVLGLLRICVAEMDVSA